MPRYIFAALLVLTLSGCSRKPVAAPASPDAGKESNPPLSESATRAPATGSGHGLNVPVPASCTAAVNLRLEQTLVLQRPNGYVENVMVCGIAQGTTVNSGGEHGSHHIITLAVQLPHAGNKLVQVAINDSLDGPITAARGQQVFAFGEGYTDSGIWVAGVHDVHCSTHAGADNGWVVVAGIKTPAQCPLK